MKLLKKLYVISVTVFIMLISNAFGQENPLDKVSWQFSITQNGCEATVIGKASIVAKWHIYGAHLPEESFTLPTELVVEKSPNYKIIGALIEPKPNIIHDDIVNEDLYLHSGEVTFKQKIKITSAKDFVLKGTYSFQTCDDAHCLPPYDGTFELTVKACSTENTKVEKNNPISIVAVKGVDSLNKGDAASLTPSNSGKLNEKERPIIHL